MPRRFPVFTVLFLVITQALSATISEYTAVTGFGILPESGDTVVVLRKFVRDSVAMYLAVRPDSCLTEVRPAAGLPYTPASWSDIRGRFARTAYVRALMRSAADADSIRDAGFKRFECPEDGIELTVDLCPSTKPLDRRVFNDLIAEIGPAERPVPVAVSVTGRWMRAHAGDLDWLKSLADSGSLSILWINHTYNHFSSKDLPLKMNFMLEKGTDVASEVLRTEQALLGKGLMPSVFFRFPGLVSDRHVFEKVLSFGLIPVGSDAWLAKGELPKSGSIVLIHANGNEPLGVREFISLLKKKRADVQDKKWRLFDLRKSVVEEGRR